jgi:hypothetical protein
MRRRLESPVPENLNAKILRISVVHHVEIEGSAEWVRLRVQPLRPITPHFELTLSRLLPGARMQTSRQMRSQVL